MRKILLVGIFFFIFNQSAYSMNPDEWLTPRKWSTECQSLGLSQLLSLLEKFQKIIKDKKQVPEKELHKQFRDFSKNTKDLIQETFSSSIQFIESKTVSDFHEKLKMIPGSSINHYLVNNIQLYAEINIFFGKLEEKTSNTREFMSYLNELKHEQSFHYTRAAIQLLKFVNSVYNASSKIQPENPEIFKLFLKKTVSRLIEAVLPYLNRCSLPDINEFISLSVLNCNNFNLSILDEPIGDNKDLGWYRNLSLTTKEIKPLLFIHSEGVKHRHFFQKLANLIESDDLKLLSFYLSCAEKAIDWKNDQKNLGLLLWRMYCNKEKLSGIGDILLAHGLSKSLLEGSKKTWSTNEKYLLFNHLVAFKTLKPHFHPSGNELTELKEKFSESSQTLLRLLQSIQFSEADWNQIHLKLPTTGDYTFILGIIDFIQDRLDDFFLNYKPFQRTLKTLVQDNAAEDFQRYLALIPTRKPFQKFLGVGRELFSIALKKQSFSMLSILLETGTQPYDSDLMEFTRQFLLKTNPENQNFLSPELKSLLLEVAARNRQFKLVHALVQGNAKWSTAYRQEPEWKASLLDSLAQSNEDNNFLQLQDYLNACDDKLDPTLKQNVVNELLREAFQQSYFNAMQWLLEQGAQPNKDFKLKLDGNTSLPDISLGHLKVYCQLGFGKQLLEYALKKHLWDFITLLLEAGADVKALLEEPLPLEDPTGLSSFWNNTQLQLESSDISSQGQQCLYHNWVMAYAHHGSKLFQNNPELLTKWVPAELDSHEVELQSQAAYYACLGFPWECELCLNPILSTQLTGWMGECSCTQNQKKPYHQACLREWFAKNAVEPEHRLRGECPVCRKAGMLIPSKSAAANP